MGLSQDTHTAPFDHRKVSVRFSVDNGIQNSAETVRLPPGTPTVHLRAFYGLLRVVYGLSAVVRSHENAGKIGSMHNFQTWAAHGNTGSIRGRYGVDTGSIRFDKKVELRAGSYDIK